MNNQPFKVVIAEDEHRIREHLEKKIPETNRRFIIAGAAANGKTALELVKKTLPDLLVTDIKMPVMDGLELIEELYLSYPELPVIILSGYDDFNYARKAIHFGVRDYILKPASKKELSEVLGKLEILLDRNRNFSAGSEIGYDSSAAATELCGKLAEYLKSHYTREILISDLAGTFNLNPTYMSRIFKQQTGRTPTRYLTELRINKAKKILSENPELEIKEISSRIGFQDQGYFSRLFKKETGISPIDYKKK